MTSRLRAALAKPFMPVFFFFGGVTWDTLTLTRIDGLLDNLILLLYLTLLGALIVLTMRADLHGPAAPAAAAAADGGEGGSLLDRARPHFPHAIQFLFGGLFSAYAIFYSQSASFTGTAVFFGLLVALLVGNEFLHDRFSNLRLLITLYSVVCFGFFTFFLPVVSGFMHTAVFLLGAVLSVIVTSRVVELIYQGMPERPRREITLAGAPAVAVIGVLVLFYFLNWIPPVPLSLRHGGIYHEATKVNDEYVLSYEKPAWYRFWKSSDDPFYGRGPGRVFHRRLCAREPQNDGHPPLAVPAPRARLFHDRPDRHRDRRRPRRRLPRRHGQAAAGSGRLARGRGDGGRPDHRPRHVPRGAARPS